MNQLLKIDIVSDVSCPWCIIGYRSLSKALQSLAPETAAHIAWKPFELNPRMPAEKVSFWPSICMKNTARAKLNSSKPET